MNLTRLVAPQKVAGEKFKYSQRDVYHHLTLGNLVRWCNQYILFGFCCDPASGGWPPPWQRQLQSSQVVRSPRSPDQEKAGDWDDSFETLRRKHSERGDIFFSPNT